MLNFFEKTYEYVGVDIGASGIKLVRLTGDEEQSYTISDFGVYTFDDDVFTQNSIGKSESVSDKLKEIAEKHGLAGKKIVTSIPAPALFTKKQRVPRLPMNELREHVEFEAANFIPHGAEAVYLDFHIIGNSGKNHYEIMVVAVKREVVDSFLDTFASAGLSVGVVDVDQFALQNVFEMNYPEDLNKTVALVNFGSRYSGITICRDGQCLLTGDVGLGSRTLTETIAESLDLPLEEAERKKIENVDDQVQELTSEFVEHAVSELSRQISYFWSASGVDGGIDKIYLAGGGSLISGIVAAMEAEAATDTLILEPTHAVDISSELDQTEFEKNRPYLGIATGLAVRTLGDKLELDA